MTVTRSSAPSNLVASAANWVLVTQWGTVGSPGFVQELAFDDSQQGTKRLESKFREKTGRVWANRTSAVTPDGKYDIVGFEEPEPGIGIEEPEPDILLGVVDHVANVPGAIVLHNGGPLDVMLALVGPAKQLDAFCVLHMVENINVDTFTVVLRFEATGTVGQSNTTTFQTSAEARTSAITPDGGK